MNFQIEIPSKTFLSGEYAILGEGTALVACTSPVFVCDIRRGQGLAAGIHRESPAGHLIRENQRVFVNFDCEFHDPHQGRGGFGASSAQFLAVWCVLQYAKRASWSFLEQHGWLQQAWLDFRAILKGKDDLSSGADLVAQGLGGLASVQLQPFRTRTLKWSYSDIGFSLIRTGVKVKTHEHLTQLEAAPDLFLTPLSREIATGVAQIGDLNRVIPLIQQFGDTLKRLGLMAESTQKLAAQFATIPGVAAIKGAGSLGADVLVVFYNRPVENAIKARAQQLQLDVVASDRDLTTGTTVRLKPHLEMEL